MLAAAAFVDITPGSAIPLAGFSARKVPYAGVASGLEANALAVRDDKTDRCAVVMTVDALFVGPDLQNRLSDRFVQVHGQRANDLVVLASHTHFAPSLDATKPGLGLLDAAHAGHVAERCTHLLDRVVSSSAASTSVQRGFGTSDASINRRRFWPLPHLGYGRVLPPEVVMAPNASGQLDSAISAWALLADSGAAIALIWHFACHPTGYPRECEVSSDFVGVVRERLRRRYGDSVPILFLQGFAGDIRPRVPETKPALKRCVRALVFGPGFASFEPTSWHRWAESLAMDVEHAFTSGAMETPAGAANAGGLIASASHEIPLATLVNGERHDRMVRCQRLKLASVIDIVAVAAEPLTGLRAFVPFRDATTVGYLGDVFGYWPTDTDQGLGGYEVRHFVAPFGLAGPLRQDLDAVFVSAMGELKALS